MAYTKYSGVDHYTGLSTDTKPASVAGNTIKLGSTFIEEDTGHKFQYGATGWFFAGVALIGDNNHPVDVQHPLPVNGDSVYAKDVDIANSDIGDFTGAVTDLFDDYTSENVAASVGAGGANPKSFSIMLERPVISSVVGFGSPDTSLSNGKILLKGIDGGTLREVDQSADNTKRGVMFFTFEQTAFIEIEVLFFTDDEVSIGGAFIPKSNYVTIGAIDGLIPIETSTTTPLASDGVYISGTIDTKNYGIMVVSVFADVVSATDGLSIQFSTDKTNWRWSDEYTIAANTGKTFSVQPQSRYMRVVYTNGATIQTVMDLQTQLKPVYIKPSSHRVGDLISAEDDAELVKAVLTAQKPDGDFTPVDATAGGNLKVAVEEFDEALTTPNIDRTTNLDDEIGLNANAMMFARVSDTIVKNARLDASTEAQITINYEHHELHDGSHYFCRGWEDIAVVTTDFLVVVADDLKWPHAVWEFQTEAEFNFELFEDTITSDDGVEIPCFNNNRNSLNVQGLGTFAGPTVTTPGTSIWRGKLGSGKQVGGESRAGSEIIMKQNTKYLFRFTKIAAGTNWLDYDFKWYEHTNRN